jgi:hypothetical protein
MRQNPDSHLDDIAKRFAATAPKRPPQGSGANEQEDERADAASNRATAIGVSIGLVLLLVLAGIALMMMHR